MSYSAFETSVEASRPVEVFHFQLGGTSYRYTSAEDIVTLSLNDYLPEAITRTKVGQEKEIHGGDLELTLPGANPFARLYIASVPGQRAKLTVQRFQRSDTPTPELVTLFQGFVRSVAFVEQAKVAKIAVMPFAAATSRPIPRFVYQSLCNHVLGDVNGCKVNLDVPAFRVNGTITAVNGNTITVPGLSGFPDGFFTSGFVEALSGLDARMVLSHVGDTIQLLLPFPFSAINQNVTVFAGCDHTIGTCKTKFNNVVNYGGFAFIPSKNPFQSGLF